LIDAQHAGLQCLIGTRYAVSLCIKLATGVIDDARFVFQGLSRWGKMREAVTNRESGIEPMLLM
jgi:hypothetical protein